MCKGIELTRYGWLSSSQDIPLRTFDFESFFLETVCIGEMWNGLRYEDDLATVDSLASGATSPKNGGREMDFYMLAVIVKSFRR